VPVSDCSGKARQLRDRSLRAIARCSGIHSAPQSGHDPRAARGAVQTFEPVARDPGNARTSSAVYAA
jgi:hypothetical protein